MKKPKLKKSSEPKFNLSDPVEFIKCFQYYEPQLTQARNLLCRGKYHEAIPQFERLLPLVPCQEYKELIKTSLAHCKKMSLGILDLRKYGCGVYWNGEKIGHDQMDQILEHGRAAGVQFGQSKRVRKVSIGGLVMNLLDEHGLEVSYDLVLAKVKEVAPESKFNPHHMAYYKSMYKSKNPGAGPKKTQAKPRPKLRAKSRRK